MPNKNNETALQLARRTKARVAYSTDELKVFSKVYYQTMSVKKAAKAVDEYLCDLVPLRKPADDKKLSKEGAVMIRLCEEKGFLPSQETQREMAQEAFKMTAADAIRSSVRMLYFANTLDATEVSAKLIGKTPEEIRTCLSDADGSCIQKIHWRKEKSGEWICAGVDFIDKIRANQILFQMGQVAEERERQNKAKEKLPAKMERPRIYKAV